MSEIYHTEPPTSGKVRGPQDYLRANSAQPMHLQVVICTSFGDIDVELWCKECPKACRNFIQLALEQVSRMLAHY